MAGRAFIAALAFAQAVLGAGSLERPWEGSDLTFFVTRPDIRAPKLSVIKHRPQSTDTGYYFLAPYDKLVPIPRERALYIPCQIGPTIYDNDGHLVWSGACQDPNRIAFDFRPFRHAGENHLSYVVERLAREDPLSPVNTGVHGVLLRDDYEVYDRISAPDKAAGWNLHEMKMYEGARKRLKVLFFATYIQLTKALSIDKRPVWANNDEFSQGCIRHDVLVEMDHESKRVDFEWWPMSQGVDLAESNFTAAPWTKAMTIYDVLHVNSAERTRDGNFIVSARFSNTIYAIDGASRQIKWRLGGIRSDFKQDFTFTSQHDARIIAEHMDGVVLSIFDNASNDLGMTADTATSSSAKLVALNTTSMTATLLKQFDRPDRQLTRSRGNAQHLLTSRNMLIGWVDGGYVSEHAEDGSLVAEARFQSSRFDTYRAYKHEWTGRPREAPLLRVVAVRDALNSHRSTMSYMSWNGATEVKSWRLVSHVGDAYVVLASAPKIDFETMLILRDAPKRIFAEALDASDVPLARTRTQIISEYDGELSTDYGLDDSLIYNASRGIVSVVQGSLSASQHVSAPASPGVQSRIVYRDFTHGIPLMALPTVPSMAVSMIILVMLQCLVRLSARCFRHWQDPRHDFQLLTDSSKEGRMYIR